MEPGNQIKPELSGKDFFLRNTLMESEQPNIYSLEAEFARSKTNRDFRPYLVFLGFILLLILLTIATANYLEMRSKQIKIDISDFEDLQLKETLNTATRQGNELNHKTNELTRLRSTYDNQIKNLQQEIQQKTQNPQDSKNKEHQKILQRQQKQLQDLEKQYEKKITQKQAEILRLENETTNTPDAEHPDYRRYYELELKKQKAYYEHKLQESENSKTVNNDTLNRKEQELQVELKQYQEIFNDSELADLSSPVVGGGDTLNLSPTRRELEQEKILEHSDFKNLRSKINQLSEILKKLRAMPNSNPAAPVFKQTNALAYSLINDYERLWSALADRLTSKNEQLITYQSALTAYLKDIHASGCVIDTGQKKKIIVFCRKGWEVDTETSVELYRGKDEYIGKLTLIPNNSGTEAKVAEVAKNKTIKPLDWFHAPVNP